MLKNPLFLFGCAIVLLIIFLPSYTAMQDLRQKNAEYDRQIRLLEQKKAELGEEKRRLQDDPVYLEKVGREKMGLIKDKEVIYQLTPVTEE